MSATITLFISALRFGLRSHTERVLRYFGVIWKECFVTSGSHGGSTSLLRDHTERVVVTSGSHGTSTLFRSLSSLELRGHLDGVPRYFGVIRKESFVSLLKLPVPGDFRRTSETYGSSSLDHSTNSRNSSSGFNKNITN